MPPHPNDDKIIKKLRKKFLKIEMIVIRNSLHGVNMCSSRPCSMCLRIMKSFVIKNIYYTNSAGVLVMEKISQMNSDHKSQLAQYNITLDM